MKFLSRRRHKDRSAISPAEISPNEIIPGAGPDFLCVGAQKAGTTWLYEQLAAHPDFWMPPRKELHYFNERGHGPKTFALQRDERDSRFLAQLQSLSEKHWLDLPGYGQLFAAKGTQLSGDITPAYCLLEDEVIQLIVRQFPALKVIFFARDPVERAWSQLSLAVRTGGMAKFDGGDPVDVQRQLLHPLVVRRSYPSFTVERWRRHLPTGQFRVFFFDDLEANPAQLQREVIRFLRGDSDRAAGGASPEKIAGEKENKLPLSAEARAAIVRHFAEELVRCANQLGGPAKNWPARYGIAANQLIHD